MITQLTEEIFLGAKVSNITQTQLNEFEDERLPSIIRVGLSYRPTDKVMLNLETSKDVDFDPVIHAGMSYQVVKALEVRAGFTSEPNTVFLGLGFQVKRFQIDYAFSNHGNLGISQQLSISMNLREAKKKQ